MTEYKIIIQTGFDWMIAAYFFLGGLSAGAYLFSVAATYWKKEFKPLAKCAAIISPIALAIGMTLLLADLGRPFGAWRLFLHFNPTSALSWGVWFINIFFIFNLSHAAALLFGKEENTRKLVYPGVLFAILVSTYTAIILTQAPGRALWHSAILPVIFLVGGLISGVALTMLLTAGKVEESISLKLGRFLGGLLLLELGLMLLEILTLLNGDAEAVIAAKALLAGSYSFLFLGIEVLAGAVIPAVILLRGKLSPAVQRLVSLLVLAGIFTMRYIIVVGGQVIG